MVLESKGYQVIKEVRQVIEMDTTDQWKAIITSNQS